MKRSLSTGTFLHLGRWAMYSLFGLGFGACTAPDFAAPCAAPPGATPAQVLAAKQSCYGATQPTLLDPRPHKDVDILFVIDNSPSMAPKQQVLAAAIPQFISAIEATGTNYHVGVVTTDLGFNVPNGTPTGVSFPGNPLASCNTAAGDDGVLQNTPCTNRSSLAGEAATSCTRLCPDPKFIPQGGARYISKVDGITNVPSLLMGGADIGPQRAFQCLSLVGDTGCGIEQPLEAAKRALDGHRSDNAGFNRRTSVLAVIFITDNVGSSSSWSPLFRADQAPRRSHACPKLGTWGPPSMVAHPGWGYGAVGKALASISSYLTSMAPCLAMLTERRGEGARREPQTEAVPTLYRVYLKKSPLEMRLC